MRRSLDSFCSFMQLISYHSDDGFMYAGVTTAESNQGVCEEWLIVVCRRYPDTQPFLSSHIFTIWVRRT